MKVLVTGGTGHLGQAIVSGLKSEQHQVRILARTPHSDPDVEWITGDLATGQGLREAVAGVDVTIHAATNSPAARRGRFRLGDFLHSPADVDVDGTTALLAAAEQAQVGHFLHVSIVGLEHLRRVPYSRRKLEAEQIVRGGRVPWTIARATGFYWLLERMFSNMLERPVVALPAGARMAPVDSDEFARFIVACVGDGPRGRREDFAGPETLTMPELMEQYLTARGEDRRIRRAPLPKKAQAALTAGNTSADARLGTTTWAQWLRRPHPFRRAAEAGDADALVSTLAPDVVLHSPVTFHPYVGREAVGGVLRLVAAAFEDWRCTAELHGRDGTVAFVFRTRVGQRELEGIDVLRLDADGLVADLTVMIRPLSGVVALAQAIGPGVEAAGIK